MKNAKTDLFRSSIRSEAMRAFSSTIDHLLRVGREREREEKKLVSVACNGINYLLGGLVVGDVSAHAKGPLDMDVVLVQLQQEHDQHEQGVYHEEREHGRVTQLFEIFSYTGLKVMLSNGGLQLDLIFFVLKNLKRTSPISGLIERVPYLLHGIIVNGI